MPWEFAAAMETASRDQSGGAPTAVEVAGELRNDELARPALLSASTLATWSNIAVALVAK